MNEKKLSTQSEIIMLKKTLMVERDARNLLNGSTMPISKNKHDFGRGGEWLIADDGIESGSSLAAFEMLRVQHAAALRACTDRARRATTQELRVQAEAHAMTTNEHEILLRTEMDARIYERHRMGKRQDSLLAKLCLEKNTVIELECELKAATLEAYSECEMTTRQEIEDVTEVLRGDMEELRSQYTTEIKNYRDELHCEKVRMSHHGNEMADAARSLNELQSQLDSFAELEEKHAEAMIEKKNDIEQNNRDDVNVTLVQSKKELQSVNDELEKIKHTSIVASNRHQQEITRLEKLLTSHEKRISRRDASLLKIKSQAKEKIKHFADENQRLCKTLRDHQQRIHIYEQNEMIRSRHKADEIKAAHKVNQSLRQLQKETISEEQEKNELIEELSRKNREVSRLLIRNAQLEARNQISHTAIGLKSESKRSKNIKKKLTGGKYTMKRNKPEIVELRRKTTPNKNTTISRIDKKHRHRVRLGSRIKKEINSFSETREQMRKDRELYKRGEVAQSESKYLESSDEFQFDIESTTPSTTESTTPSTTESTTPSNIESATPSSIESTTPSSIESTTPSSIESTTPSTIESTTSSPPPITQIHVQRNAEDTAKLIRGLLKKARIEEREERRASIDGEGPSEELLLYIKSLERGLERLGV